MAYTVRQARGGDASTIYQIWIEGIEASLGARPKGDLDYEAYFRSRLETQDEVFQFFVVENDGGEIVCWQSLSPFRSNPAVAGVMAELSAYASPRHMPGRPTMLGLEEVLRFADRSPLHYVVAFIQEQNSKALRLAEHVGLKQIGVFPRSPQAPHLPELAYLVYPCRNSQDFYVP
jgi:L-amino acid N-acyltransferase YncA